MNEKHTLVELQDTDNLLQSLNEVNNKIAKNIEEMNFLHEQQAYAIARIQGKMEDKIELVQQITHSLLFKQS